MKSALIMIDLQNDFCPGGQLAVQEGDAVIPIANQLQSRFDLVIATQDWHPQNHVSFASNHLGKKVGEIVKVHGLEQILWPDHCVQNSSGAKFHPDLDISRVNHIFHKGIDPSIDSYSAFFDNEHKRATGLADYLVKAGVQDVYIMGLATDYCVKYSCLDAVGLSLNVYVIEDACRGVELVPGDIARAMKEMLERGVKLINSKSAGRLI